MYKRTTTLLCVAGLLFSGCTPILKEVRHPGGYPGYVLDKRTVDASASKQQQLLRATIVLAMAAEISRVTVKGEDSDAFAKHLQAAVAEVNFAAADLYDTSTGKVCEIHNAAMDATGSGCSGFYANFEGNIPLIETRIIKVMLAALPTDQARKFLDQVSKGNVIGAAWSAMRTVAAGMGGMHFAFARYRSGLEIVAATEGVACDASAGAGGTIIQAAQCLGLSNDDISGRSKAIGGPVQPIAYLALMRSIAAACVDLPYSGNVATIDDSRELRRTLCDDISFNPQARPYRVDAAGKKLTAPLEGTTPQ